MDEKVTELLQRIREHGDSPSAQALNLAELAGVMLDERAAERARSSHQGPVPVVTSTVGSVPPLATPEDTAK